MRQPPGGSDAVTVTQDCGNGTTPTGTVGLRLALEGSFANGAPAAGDQITCGRMRILPSWGAGGGALCPDTPDTRVTRFGVLGPITTGPANGALPGQTVTGTNVATTPVTLGAAGPQLTGVNAAASGIGDPAVSPVVTLKPTSLGFGSVTARTQSAVQTITVRNPGTAPLTLTHNPAGASQATSSSVPPSGTGLGSILNSTATPVKFGTVNRTTSKDPTVTIKNTGNAAAALSLASFSATGTGYSVRSTTCGNLAVNGTCNVVVRFTAPNVVDTFNGTLNATAANGVPATAKVALTATTT